MLYEIRKNTESLGILNERLQCTETNSRKSETRSPGTIATDCEASNIYVEKLMSEPDRNEDSDVWTVGARV